MKTISSRYGTPKFSVIICLHIINERFYRDLRKFSRLNYPNYEIIVVLNKNAKISKTSIPVRIVRPLKSSISLGEKKGLGNKRI